MNGETVKSGKETQWRGPHYCALLIASIVLGFVTTIGVAWAIAYGTKLNSGARMFGGRFSELIVLKTGSGDYPGMHYCRVRGTECYDFWTGPGSAAFLAANISEAKGVSASDLPSWVYLPGPGLTMPPAPAGALPSNNMSYAFGWPWPAMRGLIIEYRPSTWSGRDFLWLGPGSLRIRGLPRSPVWPGFAIDWLLFAVIWFVLARLLAVPVWRALVAVPIRAKRRRKRGLCPACGYDLIGRFENGCPECGWAREPDA